MPVTALLVVETIMLVLLCLLVTGLLRSHAEILRRLNSIEAPAAEESDRWAGEGDVHPDWLPKPRETATPAFDVVGRTLAGEAIQIGVRGSGTNTLLAFLSSGCATCARFWGAFASERRPPMPGAARLVIVTKDASHESPSKLRALAPTDVPVVMSTEAWDGYRVPLSPYFIYVDGSTGEVAGEGSAGAWPQVESLLTDALADAELARGEGTKGRRSTTVARLARMDDELSAAGIGPGHPSLYAGDEDEPRLGEEGERAG
jgi:hypothetical protein